MAADLNPVPITALADVNPPNHLGGLLPSTEVSFIPMQDVSEGGAWTGHQTRRVSEVRVGYTPFIEGDVLFAKITPCMENGKGTHARGLVNGVGFGSTEFHVLRARGENCDRFIYHWSQAPALRLKAQAFMIGSAGQQRVQPDFFEHFMVPELPPTEQRRIAAVLDTLDDAMRRTEQVIAKLQQMKQGLLHDLLTRGVDENGELRPPPDEAPHLYKDSPLGRIPRDWKIVPLQSVSAHITKGATPTTFGFAWSEEGGGGVLFLRSECVRDGSFSLTGAEKIPHKAHAAMRRSAIVGGDILMTITGYIGRSCRYPEEMPEANINQHIARIRILPSSNVLPDFVAMELSSIRQTHLLERDLTGLAYPQISLAQVQGINLPVPSRSEQEYIATSYMSVVRRLSGEEDKRDKLQTLKHGLLHDLLTGRVRVPDSIEVPA